MFLRILGSSSQWARSPAARAEEYRVRTRLPRARISVEHHPEADRQGDGHVEITSVLDEKAQRFKLISAEKGAPLSKNRPAVVLGRGLLRAASPDYFMVMLDCGSNPQASKCE